MRSKYAYLYLAGLVFGAAISQEAHAFGDILARKVASWRVATSQIATASKASINAKLNIAQAQMSAIGVLASTTEQLQIYQSFSALTGQGAQVCSAVNQRNDIDLIGKTRSDYRFNEMARSGRGELPVDDYEVGRGIKQLDAYCSAEEHYLGICRSRFDGMASASTNYTKLTAADQFTSKQLKAAEDYIANLVPPPLPVQSASSCDVGCMSARMRALQMDAAASLVAVPLSMQLSDRIGAKTFAVKK